ncbi:MAG: hypothetical protein E7019_04710 [Alphaproteobacteria bacterium]|nr:hypothetical protein [Alphaproteobacteria bacterium]
MPFLTIYTNSDIDDKQMSVDAANLVANQLGKPVRYVVVNVIHNANMSFDGNNQTKGALIEMKSIGFGDKNSLAKQLTDLVVSRIDVEPSFVNVWFVDMPANTVAIGGRLLG